MKKLLICCLTLGMISGCHSGEKMELSEINNQMNICCKIIDETSFVKTDESINFESKKGMTDSYKCDYICSFIVNDDISITVEKIIETNKNIVKEKRTIIHCHKKLKNEKDIHKVHNYMSEVSLIIYKLTKIKIDSSSITECYESDDYDDYRKNNFGGGKGIDKENYTVTYDLQKDRESVEIEIFGY